MEQSDNTPAFTGEQYWREQLAGWKASGQKQMQYCREHQLSKHAFVYCKLKLLGKDSSPVTLVPVGPDQLRGVRPGEALSQIRVVVGERFHVEVTSGFDAQTLQEVLAVLERLA